jgi:4-hydroxy-4-methyl-2-oxoglutarate aldolase
MLIGTGRDQHGTAGTMADARIAALSSRLRTCGTGTVGEALDLTGFDGPSVRLRPVSPGLRFAGPVFTAKLETGARGSFPDPACDPAPYIDSTPRGAVVALEAGDAEVAILDGIAVRTAQLRGLEAIVIDGAVRDLDAILATRFPVFARGASPVSPRTRVRLIGTGMPIVLDGIAVMPGDFLVGDSTGVVRIPREAAQEVLERALVLATREQRVREAVEQELGLGIEADSGFANSLRRAGQA